MIGYDERRKLLIAQHEQLRGLIARMRSAAGRLLSADGEGAVQLLQELRCAVDELQANFYAHLLTEEAILEPILLRIDAWGPIRLDLLRAEHSHQRAVLAALRSAEVDAYSVARRAAALAEELLVDMDAEERDLLAPELLRDDPVCLDQSDA
jgi:iron-sulfur cluster repair protein YtfE (RIC family)